MKGSREDRTLREHQLVERHPICPRVHRTLGQGSGSPIGESYGGEATSSRMVPRRALPSPCKNSRQNETSLSFSRALVLVQYRGRSTEPDSKVFRDTSLADEHRYGPLQLALVQNKCNDFPSP